MTTNTNWSVSNIEGAKYLGILELENGEYFEVLETETKLSFSNTAAQLMGEKVSPFLI